jgi:hypothetical protein
VVVRVERPEPVVEFRSQTATVNSQQITGGGDHETSRDGEAGVDQRPEIGGLAPD